MSNQRIGIFEELITIAGREGYDPSPSLMGFLEDVAKAWGISEPLPDLFWLLIRIPEADRENWTFHF